MQQIIYVIKTLKLKPIEIVALINRAYANTNLALEEAF